MGLINESFKRYVRNLAVYDKYPQGYYPGAHKEQKNIWTNLSHCESCGEYLEERWLTSSGCPHCLYCFILKEKSGS